MTQLEPPGPPAPDSVFEPDGPPAPPPDNTPPTQSKAPRPAQCIKSDSQPEPFRMMAIGETLTLPPGIVQYATFDDQVISATPTEQGLQIAALKPGRIDFWYVDGSHKCTMLVIQTQSRSVG
jgi:hypothetical protein